MKNFKTSLWALFIVAFSSIIFYACQKEAQTPSITSAAGKTIKLTAPKIECDGSTSASITLKITGTGTLGAPAGVSIQWMTAEDFATYGWPKGEASDDQISIAPSFCKASLSGVPGCSSYNLKAGASVSVNIGDNLFDNCGASSSCANEPLLCGTDYVFRSFAHNDPKSGAGKSPFSANQTCSTDPCTVTEGCTFTQGYWKTHGPEFCIKGNNSNAWPATILTSGLDLGSVNYSADQLCSILNTPAKGNGLLILAHQLIAAQLNIANGADDSAVAQAITDANNLIGSFQIPPVGTSSLAPSATSSLTSTLDSYNQGKTGPGHCQ